MDQEITPNVHDSPEFISSLREFRQFNQMDRDLIAEDDLRVLYIQKLELLVGFRHARKQHIVHEANRNSLLELVVIFPLLQLLGVQFRPVEQNSWREVATSHHLHLYIILPAELVANLQIENGQLVVQR